jgi:small subunit ribosomal protein S21
MLIIDVTKEKNIEAALKAYKKKVVKTKQIQQLRDRQEFEKPSVKRRKQVMKAIYGNKKSND